VPIIPGVELVFPNLSISTGGEQSMVLEVSPDFFAALAAYVAAAGIRWLSFFPRE